MPACFDGLKCCGHAAAEVPDPPRFTDCASSVWIPLSSFANAPALDGSHVDVSHPLSHVLPREGGEVAKGFNGLQACMWCPEEDSNLHASRRCYLKAVRLPIPPSGQAVKPAAP